MSEKITSFESKISPERYLVFAQSLSAISEKIPFPFSGIEEAGYQKLKAESEEFPGLVTHIDELIARCNAEGIKIVVVKGKAFVLPFRSDDVENDSIFPRFLNVSDDMDRNLRVLVKAGKQPG